MTEKEIIDLYDSGRREEAFSGIVESYSERVYLHIRRFVCCHEDADDLVQEVFIKIWAALPSFRRDAQLFTWIYRIATNETMNFLRRQRVRAMLSLNSVETILAKKVDEDVHFNGDHLQRELQKAILKLPEKQRLVFNLRYFDDMKYEGMNMYDKDFVVTYSTNQVFGLTDITDQFKTKEMDEKYATKARKKDALELSFEDIVDTQAQDTLDTDEALNLLKSLNISDFYNENSAE